MFSVIELTSWLVVSPDVPAVPFRKPKGVPAPRLLVGSQTVVGAVAVPVLVGVGVPLPPVDPEVTVTVNGPTATSAPSALGCADDSKSKVTLEVPVSVLSMARSATTQKGG
jgi:hypothetical protein